MLSLLVLLIVQPALFEASWEGLRADGLALLRTMDFSEAEDKLQKALEDAPQQEHAKLYLLLGRARLASKRYREAIEALSAINQQEVSSDLAELTLFELAKASALAGLGDAKDLLMRFVNLYPRSDRIGEVRLLLARLAFERGDKVEAVQQAKLARDGLSDRAMKAEAMLIAAHASDGREESLKRIYIAMPETPAATRTGLAESDLSTIELEQRAAAFYDIMDYEEAQRIREGLWRNGKRSPDLALKLAVSHLKLVRDDPKRALEMLDIAERGGAVSRVEAQFLRARAYAKMEDYSSAIAIYRKALASGVKGERRIQALYYLGWLPYDKGEYAKALPFLNKFLKEVKSHELRSYILWAKGWSLYQLRRYPEAIKVFEEMEALGNCLVAGKAMYWAGMAYRAMGDKKRASNFMERVVDTYPLTWYAVLAAKRLAEWDKKPLPIWITGPAAQLQRPEPLWPFDELPEGLAKELRRVKDLSEIGEIARARKVWESVARDIERRFTGKKKARLLLTIHDALEDYYSQYARSEKEFGGEIGRIPDSRSAMYWMLAYPEAHRPIARVVSKKFKIPEHWIYAIMRQESRYRPAQVSHTAALGLMQMIPKTAKIVARALGKPFDVQTFFEPGRNILFCSYYLAELLREFKGQIVFASAAYNAGAPPIKRFLARHRGLPFDAMVEFIAYNEARNYCRKVAEHLIRYAYLHLGPEERMELYARIFPDQVDYDVGNEVNY